MKASIAIVLFVTMALLCAGQDEIARPEYHVTTSASWSDFEEVHNLNLHVSFGIRKRKHEWEFGPTFLMFPNYRRNNSESMKLTGMHCTYRLIPNPKGKVFDFYLQSNFSIQRIVDEWSASIWDFEQELYVYEDLRDIETLMQISVGYGLRVNAFDQRVFIFHNVNYGAHYSDLEDPYEERLEVEYDFRGYSDFGTNWLVTVGLGYKF